MEKVKEYMVVQAPTPEKLVGIVNEMINEGWQPVGGITFWTNVPIPIQEVSGGSEHSVNAVQALVR